MSPRARFLGATAPFQSFHPKGVQQISTIFHEDLTRISSRSTFTASMAAVKSWWHNQSHESHRDGDVTNLYQIEPHLKHAPKNIFYTKNIKKPSFNPRRNVLHVTLAGQDDAADMVHFALIVAWGCHHRAWGTPGRHHHFLYFKAPFWCDNSGGWATHSKHFQSCHLGVINKPPGSPGFVIEKARSQSLTKPTRNLLRPQKKTTRHSRLTVCRAAKEVFQFAHVVLQLVQILTRHQTMTCCLQRKTQTMVTMTKKKNMTQGLEGFADLSKWPNKMGGICNWEQPSRVSIPNCDGLLWSIVIADTMQFC